MIICKLILKDDSFAKFVDSVKLEIDRLSSKLSTIGIEDVLQEMGFPANWYDIKAL